MNKRIEWIDIAKGYGIILVIFAHTNNSIVSNWFYSFHLPLFFFLSGYVFSTKYDFSSFIKRKVQTMIVPYFALGIPMIIFDCFFSGKLELHFFIDKLVRIIIQRRLYTLWFIACLFFLNIIFFFLVKGIKKEKHILVISALMGIIGVLYANYVCKPLPWNIDVCFTAIPFFCSGYFLKLKENNVKKYLDGKKSLIMLIILGIVNVGCWIGTLKLSGASLEMWNSSYGFAPLTYIAAFAGLYCVIIASRNFSIKPLQYIGQNSLIYFAWHQTIIMPMIRLISNRIAICNIGYLYNTIETIVIILILTIVNEIIRRSKLKFIIGK